MNTQAEAEAEPEVRISTLLGGIALDARRLFVEQMALFQVEIKNDINRILQAFIPILAGMMVVTPAIVLMGVAAALGVCALRARLATLGWIHHRRQRDWHHRNGFGPVGLDGAAIHQTHSGEGSGRSQGESPMENEELIRQRMEKTRESLTEKLETLEDKLVGSVQEVTSAVRETVVGVKETMHESVESVKDAVDIPAHVQHRPWLMFGGAILGGYVLGSLLTRETQANARRLSATQTKRPSTGNGHHKPAPPPEQPAKPEGGFHAIEPELQHLKGLALGVTLGTIREMVVSEVPSHLGDELRSIIDSVTRKLGGEPIGKSDLPYAEPIAPEMQSPSSPFGGKPRW